MARLTKEEKIKRLQEKIRAIESGEDIKAIRPFENKYFYIKTETRRIIDAHGNCTKETYCIPMMKTLRFSAYKKDDHTAYQMRFDNYSEWKKAILELIEYMDGLE